MKQLSASPKVDLPAFVISLDFELRWGMHDRLGCNMNGYRMNLENARLAVPALLKLFTTRKIRATWACVGALGCHDWAEYFSRAPQPPKYEDPRLAINPRYAELDPKGHLHFAPELLVTIHASSGQELGSHTFSHLLMRERGVTEEDVKADLAAVSLLWKERFGALPRSLVFPRSQCAFLPVIRAASIRIWRGNPRLWYYNCDEVVTNRFIPRALRLVDSINPWAHRASVLEGDMTRASLFLRTNLPRPAWALHVARIRRELNALRPGEIFHLWCHPHNLGAKTAARLARVEEVLDLAAEKCVRGLVASRCMGDLIS